MKKQYAIINLISSLAFVIFNIYVSSRGLHGNTVSGVSAELNNYFVPASYAFSIWTVIFIAIILMTFHHLQQANKDEDDGGVIVGMGPWLSIANVANTFWLVFWLNGLTFLSVVVMLVGLVSLLTIVVRLNMQIVPASKDVKQWTWFPISLYSGWLTVATVANISAYLAKIGFASGPSETIWAALIIGVSMAIFVYVLLTRNMPVFALVGAWALVAIAVKHWGQNAIVQWIAALAAIIILTSVIYSSSRKTNAS